MLNFSTTHISKESLLDTTISYNQLPKIKLVNYSTKLNDSGEFTLKELKEININPRFLFTAILREKILPNNTLHKLSLIFCKDFINHVEEDINIFDSRYEALLDSKELWILNSLSSTYLTEVQRKAHLIFSESTDQYSDAMSYAVYSATLDNPIESIRGVMQATEKIYDLESQYKRWQDLLFNEIA